MPHRTVTICSSSGILMPATVYRALEQHAPGLDPCLLSISVSVVSLEFSIVLGHVLSSQRLSFKGLPMLKAERSEPLCKNLNPGFPMVDQGQRHNLVSRVAFDLGKEIALGVKKSTRRLLVLESGGRAPQKCSF